MKPHDLPKVILRIALSLVFIYFGLQQVISPDSWTSFIPHFLTTSFLSANNLVMMNAFGELVLGLMLLFGIYTRFSSILLSIHLILISFSLGLSPIGVRDFGLAIATFVVFLNGPDSYCLDNKFTR